MSSAQSLSWLRIARELRGMTQDDLAEASGLSKVAISKLENSHRLPRWETAQKLAKALGVEAQKLFPDEDQQSPADVLADHLGLGDG